MCKIVKKKFFFSGERNKENIVGVDPFQLCPGGGGTPHMKGVGMLVGNFELNS